MFGRIAGRYDLLNRLMTGGQDRCWRREAVGRLAPPSGGRVLDLGSGTGDLAFELLRHAPQARVVAADFTPEMMTVGRRRPDSGRIAWVVADALHLPFAQASFAGAISGFLLRNVTEIDRVLAEELRVLCPGGRAVSLDTTPPAARVPAARHRVPPPPRDPAARPVGGGRCRGVQLPSGLDRALPERRGLVQPHERRRFPLHRFRPPDVGNGGDPLGGRAARRWRPPPTPRAVSP